MDAPVTTNEEKKQDEVSAFPNSMLPESQKKQINVLLLFDVDGTLSPSRLQANKDMWRVLQLIKQHPNVKFGLVGGSDFVKQQDQLGGEHSHIQFKGMNLKDNSKNNRGFFNYVFSENGLVAFRNLNNESISIIDNKTLENTFKLENELFNEKDPKKISEINKKLEPLFNKIDNTFDKLKYENDLNKIQQINDDGIAKAWNTEETNKIVSWWLKAIAEIYVYPMKTGTFVEYRTGMLNTCPVGRNCTQKQRLEFYKYDTQVFPKKPTSDGRTLRETLVHNFYQYLDEPGNESLNGKVKCSIGGQISVDIFPVGWDKRYCLQFVEREPILFDELHFFGDKTYVGGNDVEIYTDKRTIGHSVTGPDHTRQYIREIVMNLNARNAKIAKGAKKEDLIQAPFVQEPTIKREGAH